MTSLGEVFHLMQEEEPADDGMDTMGEKTPWWEFWDWVDPEADLLEESTNQILIIFGLAFETVGAAFWMFTIVMPIWWQQVELGWWEYVMLVVALFDFLFIVWGWVKFFDYYSDPSPETTFRAWRANWLAGSINIPMNGLYTLFYVIWVMHGTTVIYRQKMVNTDNTVTPATTTTVYYPMAGYATNIWYIWYYTGAWLGMVGGWFLTWFIKNLWYTYDPQGAVSYTDFDWFGLSSALAGERNYYTDTVKEAEEAEEEAEGDEAADEADGDEGW